MNGQSPSFCPTESSTLSHIVTSLGYPKAWPLFGRVKLTVKLVVSVSVPGSQDMKVLPLHCSAIACRNPIFLLCCGRNIPSSTYAGSWYLVRFWGTSAHLGLQWVSMSSEKLRGRGEGDIESENFSELLFVYVFHICGSLPVQTSQYLAPCVLVSHFNDLFLLPVGPAKFWFFLFLSLVGFSPMTDLQKYLCLNMYWCVFFTFHSEKSDFVSC